MSRLSSLRSLGCLVAAGTALAAFAPAAQPASGPTATVDYVRAHGTGTAAVGGTFSCVNHKTVKVIVHYVQLEGGDRAKGDTEVTGLSCGPQAQKWTATVPVSGHVVPGRPGEVRRTMEDAEGAVLVNGVGRHVTTWDTPRQTADWDSYITKVDADGVNANISLTGVCKKGEKFTFTVAAKSANGAAASATSPEITCASSMKLAPKALGKTGAPDFQSGADITATVTMTSGGVQVSKRTLTLPAGY